MVVTKQMGVCHYSHRLSVTFEMKKTLRFLLTWTAERREKLSIRTPLGFEPALNGQFAGVPKWRVSEVVKQAARLSNFRYRAALLVG
jgi:hypothetical protein